MGCRPCEGTRGEVEIHSWWTALLVHGALEAVASGRQLGLLLSDVLSPWLCCLALMRVCVCVWRSTATSWPVSPRLAPATAFPPRDRLRRQDHPQQARPDHHGAGHHRQGPHPGDQQAPPPRPRDGPSSAALCARATGARVLGGCAANGRCSTSAPALPASPPSTRGAQRHR